jgi:hypothetical protein
MTREWIAALSIFAMWPLLWWAGEWFRRRTPCKHCGKHTEHGCKKGV